MTGGLQTAFGWERLVARGPTMLLVGWNFQFWNCSSFPRTGGTEDWLITMPKKIINQAYKIKPP
jgi:hypothetical protein